MLWFQADGSAHLVETLRCKPEGCKFDTWWCQWNFSVTKSFRLHYGPQVNSASKRNSTRNIAWGVMAASAYGWQSDHLHVLIVLKLGSLTLLEPSVPVQAWRGIALILSLCYSSQNNPNNVSAMDLTSGKYSRSKMATHSGFWVGALLAGQLQEF